MSIDTPKTIEASTPHSRQLRILDIGVDVHTMTSAVDRIGDLIQSKTPGYICLCDVHSIMRAQDDDRHRTALQAAEIVLSDGMPLVWVGHMRGHPKMKRVSGPDLMLAVCERSVKEGWSHYFFGGDEGVADAVANTLHERYPGLKIAGTYCPPFRATTDAEDKAMLDQIGTANPDILWVGLGCPKQEIWMHKNRHALNGMTVIGVGAAFDFNCGRIPRAPAWMRASGLEWSHRLFAEPRRLWRRYLVLAPRFAIASLAEQFKLMRSTYKASPSPRN